MDALAGGKILVAADGPIFEIVINNPDRRNAISSAMWRGLVDAVAAAHAEAAARVIILRGAGGRAFVSGADLSEFGDHRADPASAAAYDAAAEAAYAAFEASGKPVLARIDGWCVGGGVLLAAACDLRICDPVARFAIPAAKLGVAPPAGAVARLVRLIGVAAAKEMLLTAAVFDASKAAAWGLVNRIAAEAALAAETAALAAGIAANAPLSLAAGKAAVDAAAGSDWDPAALAAFAADCAASADYAEGLRAHAEGRPPRFDGR